MSSNSLRMALGEKTAAYEKEESSWRWLHKLGSAAALISVLVIPLTIVANIITLGFYLPVIGIYLSIFSVLFYWVWYLLIARRLWKLSAD